MHVMALFLPEIKELLGLRDFRSVRRLLDDINPVDLADGWMQFTPHEQAALFRLLPRRKAAQVFEELETPEQEALLKNVREVDIKELVTDLDPSQAMRLSRELPPKLVQKLFTFMKKDKARQVENLLHFPPESVGGLMRTRFVRLRPEWSAKQALEHVQITTRLRQIDQTYLDNLEVTDEGERLVGYVPLRVLIVAPRDMGVQELMRKSPLHLSPEMDREAASNLFRKYKLASAPVLDNQGRILGVVLVRDVIEVIGEEAEEDIAKMAGTSAGLLDLPVFRMAWVRSPWLLATCFGYIFVSKIIQHYEPVLTQVIALTSFMPLIAAMGGNIGAQTATIVVRGLATGEIEAGDWSRVLLKETGVGVLLGTFYGALMAGVSFVLYGERFGWEFSLVVGLGMAVSSTTAAMIASGEPFVFHHFKIDPATATAPLITCIADMVSTAAYLTVAAALLLG